MQERTRNRPGGWRGAAAEGRSGAFTRSTPRTAVERRQLAYPLAAGPESGSLRPHWDVRSPGPVAQARRSSSSASLSDASRASSISGSSSAVAFRVEFAARAAAASRRSNESERAPGREARGTVPVQEYDCSLRGGGPRTRERTKTPRRRKNSRRPEQPTIMPTSHTTSRDLTA